MDSCVNPAEGWPIWKKTEVTVSDFYKIWYTYYWAICEKLKNTKLYLTVTSGYGDRPYS
jgi:hypothetical protein